MKRISLISALISFFILLSAGVSAQDDSSDETGKPDCKHKKHHWHISDSTGNYDFSYCWEECSPTDFPFCCKKHNKYNGHWAGFDLGFGGYLTPDFDMNYGNQYPYLEMNNARSLMVNFNIFELNANLYKNHIGFTTGLGFQVNNYFFTGNYIMLKDSATLKAYKVQDNNGNYVNLKTNKLVTSYLNLPLFFEYQTNPYKRISSFHVTVGVIAGVRIGSYTKQYYENGSGTYYLVDDNGNKVATYDVDKNKVHTRGAYHLSPFKVDAAFRIGWSHLNLFGTYSLTQMFQKDKGPEVYPFTVGLSFSTW